MNEFDLISLITRALPTNNSVVVGAGDDCAVLDLDLRDRWLLFKTDAVVEGIHFPAGTRPENIGHKALGRCLSDIAAMAGTPTAAVPLLDAWKKQFPKLALSCIGKITAGQGITLRDKNGARPLTAHGYEHFA